LTNPANNAFSMSFGRTILANDDRGAHKDLAETWAGGRLPETRVLA